MLCFVHILCRMIGNFFLRNKIETNTANHFIYGCGEQKSPGYLLWVKNGHEKCQNIAKLSPKKRNILNFFLKLNNF
jgi:hypothetical protein